MAPKRKVVKRIKNLAKKFRKQSKVAMRKQRLLLLRSFLFNNRKRRNLNAGFVLPTVAMVALVVVLLTTAILFRSFERSKNASNVRVNEVVLNAAMPAVDRARAKIQKLFNDPTLPRSTPSDTSLDRAFSDINKYTFGDETPLVVNYDLNGNKQIDPNANTELEKRETINTSWRFPVDTDNNGKFDSHTLYGIFFRSPSRGDDGKFNSKRNPLDARTPPMDDGSLGGLCAAAKGTSASLVGESGWYKSGANIKKSFFVYVATVPIDDEQIKDESLSTQKYEQYKGNKGFSALEFQQDQQRTPIVNNAVVYEDDLEITPGSGLNLNGSIFTNSNLLTAKVDNRDIQFYQVSSPKSCFYTPQNSKIVVGGNVGLGRVTPTNKQNPVKVDLFKPGAKGSQQEIDSNNKSANNTSGEIAFNTQAYAQRINALVEQQTINTKDPKEVEDNIAARLKDNKGLDQAEVRREELEAYFKKRTRKVPFAEVGLNQPFGTASLQGVGTDNLRPQDEWAIPVDNNGADYTKLTLNKNKLPATEPSALKEVNKEEEKYLGDRILVGNNLPVLRYDKTGFVGKETPQKVKPDTLWDKWTQEDKKYRTRTTRVEQLISLAGATERDGFFELKATQKPKNALDNVGGMRVVTGAGIYVDGPSTDTEASYAWDAGSPPKSFLASLRPSFDTNLVGTGTNQINVNSLNFNGKTPIVVWSDTMPMTPGSNQPGDKGDLLMRATAVYFYKDATDKDNSGTDQVPIACVSSYYDPTNSTTAQNDATKIGFWKNPGVNPSPGKSNNGIVYPPPYTSPSARQGAIGNYSKKLRQQARLVFPNGRFVNEPLRNALQQFDSGKTLSMTDNSAIDTAVCAIKILDEPFAFLPNPSPPVPHGAIYETAFLDARQIKAVEQETNVYDPTNANLLQNFDRAIEDRQPLEVRVTVLDLDQLRKKKIGGSSSQEYLIPNSGIIYATRDDALPDLSDSPANKAQSRKLISPTDYKLDPTRRPNGIMLINGGNLTREPQYRDAEKGLILASNVPAYVKGNFNRHLLNGTDTRVEEFKDQLRDTQGNISWDKFYDRATLDDNFACRQGDPRLPKNKCQTGDSWRPATVLADSVTILSDNFRFGFRNEGDYDLRNNAGNVVVSNYDFNGNGVKTDTLNETTVGVDLNGDGDTTDTSVSEANQISALAVRKQQGFFDNNFLTSSQWFNISGSNRNYPIDDFDPNQSGNQPGSSYVNNFVTPIQRRVEFGEYLMEICRKVPVSSCTPGDWVVSSRTATTPRKASDIAQEIAVNTLDSGTTATVAKDIDDQRFPRRVAYLRDSNNTLILDKNGLPVPIGVDGNAKIKYYPYNDLKIPVKDKKFDTTGTVTTISAFSTTNRPRNQQNALWFRTANDSSPVNPSNTINYGRQYPLFYLNKLTPTTPASLPSGSDYKLSSTTEQPLLVPVLQFHTPTSNSNNNSTTLPIGGIATDANWLPTATETTTNLVIAGGDTPGRSSESNGGLENFVRYLENWRDINHNITGSLIQYKRSAYASGPWQTVQLNGTNPISTSIFGNDYPQYYKIDNTPIGSTKDNGMTPFYVPPKRQWGFDVALLSQLPDLFAEQFTIPPATKPNEFFREVSRDDDWVQTLLCAKIGKNNAVSDDLRPTGFCKNKTDV